MGNFVWEKGSLNMRVKPVVTYCLFTQRDKTNNNDI